MNRADLARLALPLMSPAQRAEAEELLADLRTSNAQPESLEEFKQRAADAFEADMRPVCLALAGALHANDLAALKGLQALLPGLLREVNKAPALADLLALQLGQTFLDAMKEETEENLKAESGKQKGDA